MFSAKINLTNCIVSRKINYYKRNKNISYNILNNISADGPFLLKIVSLMKWFIIGFKFNTIYITVTYSMTKYTHQLPYSKAVMHFPPFFFVLVYMQILFISQKCIKCNLFSLASFSNNNFTQLYSCNVL